MTSKEKKSKKRDFVPISVDPYPPTKKREVLIRDNFDFFSTPNPPYRKRDISEKKIWLPSTFILILKGIRIGVKIIFHPFHLNLLSRGHNQSNYDYVKL